jgi:hypothetical protein
LKEISTEITINAEMHKVWQILTEFGEYNKWNPFVRKIEGTAKVGSRLKIHLHTSKGKTRTYRPYITKVEPHKELRWYGKSILPGIFNGERIFTLESISKEQTKFIHKEIFAGILVDLIGNRLDKDILDIFTEMNDDLKKWAET